MHLAGRPEARELPDSEELRKVPERFIKIVNRTCAKCAPTSLRIRLYWCRTGPTSDRPSLACQAEAIGNPVTQQPDTQSLGEDFGEWLDFGRGAGSSRTSGTSSPLVLGALLYASVQIMWSGSSEARPLLWRGPCVGLSRSGGGTRPLLVCPPPAGSGLGTRSERHDSQIVTKSSRVPNVLAVGSE